MQKLNVRPGTLFCADNLAVLRGINSDCIDLIYLDPPFNKNKTFSATAGSRAAGAAFVDVFRQKDIKDEWIKTIEYENPALAAYLSAVNTAGNQYNYCYLVYMAIRILQCHRVLKNTGSVYLHCDPTMSHYLKIVMDCIFGEVHFRNEIVWRIGWVSGYKTQKKGWVRNHDIILYYVKSAQAAEKFNKEFIPYPPGYVRRDGKVPTGKGFPIEDTWNCHYGDTLDSIMIKSFSDEKTGYPTQKPLALMARIIKSATAEGDIVLDPFCGCATTCVAAERLHRDWVGVDVSVKAYELVKTRLKKEVTLFKPKDPHYRTTPPKRGDTPGADSAGYVYIISNAAWAGMFKLGIAKDPQRRLSGFQTSDPHRAYRLEYTLHTPFYKEIESRLHKKFNAANEWIKQDFITIKKAVLDLNRKLIKDRGIAE